MTTLSRAFEELLGVSDKAEISFLVGGSVASGIHGLPRFTNDIDIVIDLPLDAVDEFCEAFGPRWYADRDMVAKAVGAGRSFNLIYIESAYKFDFFPVGDAAFGRSELARRRHIEFPVASAEDTILAKLVWYRQGGETSDRQWRDILSVIQVQAGRLELPYLEKWAAELGVSHLLQKLMTA